MEQFLKKMGWTSIITSLSFAVIGLIIAYNPNATFTIISYLIGIAFILFGIMKVIEYFKMKGSYDLYNYELVYGIITILLGVVVIVWSGMIETLLRIFVGIWIIYSGAMRLGLALKVQKLDSDSRVWAVILLIAVAMLLCGIYIIANPGTVIMTIGIIMVIYAVMDIIEEVIFLKKVKNIQ